MTLKMTTINKYKLIKIKTNDFFCCILFGLVCVASSNS